MRLAAAALLFCVLTPSLTAAHEIGTTNVRLTHDSAGSWIAVITTAPQSLLNELEVESGLRRSQGLDAMRLRQQLEALLPALASHLDLRFDGTRCPLTASIDRLEVPAEVTRAAFAIIRGTCEAPVSNATAVSWSDDLVYSTYALTLERAGAPRTVWIEAGGSASLLLYERGADARLAVVGQYLMLGFEHILPRGVDHILFVLGMFLVARSLRPILVQVTSFTLAHSLTLGLTMYGIVSLPPKIVEPLIAVSIA